LPKNLSQVITSGTAGHDPCAKFHANRFTEAARQMGEI